MLAKTGLKLGGANKMGGGIKNTSLMAAMAAEDNLFGGAKAPLGAKNTAAALDFTAAPAKPLPVASTPITLALEEKVSVTLNREGSVESAEVKGTLTLTANTDAGAMALVSVNKASLPPHFNYATHPKVDKKMYEQQGGVLSMKGGKGLPVNRPVGVFRWSYQGDDAAPLSINCWPESDGAGRITVNIEMELTRQDVVLEDVNILLPLGTTEAPAIENIDGQYKHDPRQGMMCWHFDQVDSSTNANGSLEFSISGQNPEAFFPIQVGFRSETLLCPLQVSSVINQTTGAAMPHQIQQSFTPEVYQVA